MFVADAWHLQVLHSEHRSTAIYSHVPSMDVKLTLWYSLSIGLMIHDKYIVEMIKRDIAHTNLPQMWK